MDWIHKHLLFDGEDTPPEPGTPPETDLSVIVDGLIANGEFAKNMYQDFKFTVQHVTNMEALREKMKQVAAGMQSFIDAEKSIDDQIATRTQQIEAKYKNVKGNGDIDPALLAELQTDPTLKELQARKKDAQNKKRDMYNKLTNDIHKALGKPVDLSLICCGGSLDLTDDQLAQGRADFWDPKGEIFSALEVGDYVFLMLGWKDAPSPRYQLQSVFKGIITDKSHVGNDASPSITSLSYQDERCIGNKELICNTYGGDNGIKDSDFIKSMMNECGLNAVTGETQNRSSITVNNTTPSKVVDDLRKDNGLGATVVIDPVTGQTVLNLLPQAMKDKYFYFSWGYNIHGINLSKKPAEATDKSQDGTPDTTGGETANSPKSPEKPTGKVKPTHETAPPAQTGGETADSGGI